MISRSVSGSLSDTLLPELLLLLLTVRGKVADPLSPASTFRLESWDVVAELLKLLVLLLLLFSLAEDDGDGEEDVESGPI